MEKAHKFGVSARRSQDIVYSTIAAAEAKGTMVRRTGRYEGGRLELGGQMVLNLGTCSYLGLDKRDALRQAAIAATQEYGTQFAVSRAYLECSLYHDLEANLEQIAGRPVLVAPTTTLAHIAALPVLVCAGDAVVIDQSAHASLHTACELLRDVPVQPVRHNRMDLFGEMMETLTPRYERVWLVMDGLYSMFGDFAPFEELALLLDRFPRLHLYIDDAHATGWLGAHGCGCALTHFSNHDRVVVALSLCKSFAAAGGALALPDNEIKTRIRRCGGPMLFSGPIQPPMLGAAVASSQFHLSDLHAAAQASLMQRIDYALAAAGRVGLPLATQHRTPIFFIPCNSVDEMMDEVKRLHEEGFYVCPSAFPAVPVNRPGIRFTVSLHNQPEDLDAFITEAAVGVHRKTHLVPVYGEPKESETPITKAG